MNNTISEAKPERIVKTLTLKEESRAWVEEMAAKENRSVSNFIETLILRHKAAAEAQAAKISPVADDSGSDSLVGSVRGDADVPPGVPVAAGGK